MTRLDAVFNTNKKSWEMTPAELFKRKLLCCSFSCTVKRVLDETLKVRDKNTVLVVKKESEDCFCEHITYEPEHETRAWIKIIVAHFVDFVYVSYYATEGVRGKVSRKEFVKKVGDDPSPSDLKNVEKIARLFVKTAHDFEKVYDDGH